MKRSGSAAGLILLVGGLLLFASAANAATTVMQVKLGDTITGNIGTAGVDMVQARLNAAEGTSVKVTARAQRGSTLRPTVMVRNAAGQPIGTGTPLSIEWLPVRHVVHFFNVPADGVYNIEIGGSSGNGGFTASITGSPPSGRQLANISGTVTNALTSAPIAGAGVQVGPFSFTTNASGGYSGQIPAGNYMVTVQATGFVTKNQAFDLTGTSGTLNVGLMPDKPVSVTASVSGDAVPGGTLTATFTIETPDGSSVESISWTQHGGVPANIAGADTETATVTLGALGDYKAELYNVLREPPVSAEELPPNVELPPGEFVGGLQSRFQVVGVNPFTLEETGLVVLQVDVTTTSGTYSDEVEIHTALPWKVSTGLRNVPVGAPVLLYGKEQAVYDWTLTPPAGSAATLQDAATRTPEFVPDIPGLYTVRVTEDGPADAPLTLQIYAGTWRGVVVDQDMNGRPVSDTACTVCHNVRAPDMFTPWAQTGHAEIFTNNVNSNARYNPGCFGCHTVGYDTGVANGGVDDAPDWGAFMGSGLIGTPGDNWTRMLADYPASAQLSNIQCENCHGPQSSDPGRDNRAHGWNAPQGAPRVDLSADVCATCHGEPLRHARFQQWQLSPHANYELAVGRGDSGNCSRCHTVNGFLAWVPILLDDDPNTDPLDDVEVTWTEDETHPQTCVTCHDPHNIGTTSGNNPNVNIRVSDNTPPLIAGFTATDVGRGAMCITCHNSRRGLRNDTVYPDYVGTSEVVRAAHGSAQGDVLMGQNAYLIQVGQRGGHSFLQDTCVTCHMKQTPPPDALAYNQGGANHTFYASKEICGDCHKNLKAEDVQDGVHQLLDDIEVLVEGAWVSVMDVQIQAGNRIDFGGGIVITDVDQIDEVNFGETRGGQALSVDLTDGRSRGFTRLADIRVLNAAGVTIGRLYEYGDPRLHKAGWNWTLFHNDGSDGAHNPFFALEGLSAARSAMWALTGQSPVLAPENDLREAWSPPDRPRDRKSRRQL